MRTIISSVAIALLFAVTAHADVIHSNTYEEKGAADGTGFSKVSSNMDFTDGGGDLIGFSANNNPLTTGAALGLSSAKPNSGSFHYAVNVGQTTPGNGTANNWGGSWTGISSTSALSSGGFRTQADVIAAGSGKYINYTAGAVFTVSAMVATDAANPMIGAGTAAPRLEFFNSAGIEQFRNSSAQVNATTISSTYTLLTHSYTLTAADVLLGITRVGAVLGTDGNGHNPGVNQGLVYYDDFKFEVSAANVVTLAIPEPGSACVLLTGLLGFCGIRRRKN